MGFMVSKAYIVYEDEQAAVYTKGKMRIVEGPELIPVDSETEVVILNKVQANEGEYLCVTYKDGRQQNIPGPASMFINPAEHKDISVYKALFIGPNEFAVFEPKSLQQNTSKEEEDDDDDEEEENEENNDSDSILDSDSDGKDELAVRSKKEPLSKRKIVYGPCIYVPTAKEKTVCFNSQSQLKHRIVSDPQLLTLQGLKTLDNISFDLKLTVTYEVVDVDSFLDSSADPLGVLQGLLAEHLNFSDCRYVSPNFQQSLSASVKGIERLKKVRDGAREVGCQLVSVLFSGINLTGGAQNTFDDRVCNSVKSNLDTTYAVHKQYMADFKLQNASREQKISNISNHLHTHTHLNYVHFLYRKRNESE